MKVYNERKYHIINNYFTRSRVGRNPDKYSRKCESFLGKIIDILYDDVDKIYEGFLYR